MLGKKKNNNIKTRQGRKAPSSAQNGKNNNKVFSYYSSRSQIETARPRNDTFDQKTKTSNRDLRHIPTLFALLVIVFSIGYATMINTANPKIVPLSPTSISILKQTDYYQQSFEDILSESIMSKSKITIDTKDLEKKILKKHPELQDVSINIPLVSKRPVIQISPAIPVLIITSNTGEFVIGDNGKVLMNMSEVPENQYQGLIRVKDSVISDIGVGETVLPLSTLEFIDDIKYQFQQRNFEAEYIELPAIANELHVRPRGEGYIVKYNLQIDAREQTGVYFTLLDKLKAESAALPKEYIDVRIESRAYYK